jgi:hypothetical protein
MPSLNPVKIWYTAIEPIVPSLFWQRMLVYKDSIQDGNGKYVIKQGKRTT